MRLKSFLIILFLLFTSVAVAQTVLDGDSVLDGEATSQTQILNIFVKCEARNIPATSAEQINFTRVNCADKIVTNVTNVSISSKANLTVYGNTAYPSEWGESRPSNTIMPSLFRAFELNVSQITAGNYTVFFNLTKNYQLGSVGVNNVRLFWYNGSKWTNLSTTVVDNSTDPVTFYAITTNFSKFLIGGIEINDTTTTTIVTTTSGGSSGGGGGGGSGGSSGGPTFITPPEEGEEDETSPPEAPSDTEAPSSETEQAEDANPLTKLISGFAVVDFSKPYWQAAVIFLSLIIALLLFFLIKKRRQGEGDYKDKVHASKGVDSYDFRR